MTATNTTLNIGVLLVLSLFFRGLLLHGQRRPSIPLLFGIVPLLRLPVYQKDVGGVPREVDGGPQEEDGPPGREGHVPGGDGADHGRDLDLQVLNYPLLAGCGLLRTRWRWQNYSPPGGGQPKKKYFEVTHRVQGEVHAKFGWNPSSSLSSKSEQTNKQTDRQTGLVYIYIDEFELSGKRESHTP